MDQLETRMDKVEKEKEEIGSLDQSVTRKFEDHGQGSVSETAVLNM